MSQGLSAGVTPGHSPRWPLPHHGAEDGMGLIPYSCAVQPGSSLATAGCWQQGREQASPLSAAIFRCWREAEER